MKHFATNIFFIFFTLQINAQQIKVLTKGTKTSLRGLCAVTDKIIWASGSAGTVAKSLDSGNTWKWMTVKGFEKKDFRDIEAFDENTAIIMAVDSPAYILKTTDGGENWKTVYENHTKGMFLDAMAFSDETNGTLIGDPINGKFFIARTKDGGNSWQEEIPNNLPSAAIGEACFASSGTNIRKLSNGKEIFVSGGLCSNLFISSKKIVLPILQGKESTGANSIAAKNNKIFIVVGGDFTERNQITQNCLVTTNAGKSWKQPQIFPTGYRSCIQHISKKMWITCGLNGVDVTTNDGKIFTQISTESFHVCSKSKYGNAVFFAGQGGKIAILYN